MSAAQVLHEGVSGSQDNRGASAGPPGGDPHRLRPGPGHRRDPRDAGAVPRRAVRRDRRLRGRSAAADRLPDRVPRRSGLPDQPDRGRPDLLLRPVRAPRAALPRGRPRRLRGPRQIIGISKLTRLVPLFAHRFTVQERLGLRCPQQGTSARVDPHPARLHRADYHHPVPAPRVGQLRAAGAVTEGPANLDGSGLRPLAQGSGDAPSSEVRR